MPRGRLGAKGAATANSAFRRIRCVRAIADGVAIELLQNRGLYVYPGVGTVVAFGVFAALPPAATPEELIQRADHALYRAKAAGRDRVEVDQIA